MFKSKNVDKLSSHRSYNHKIKLLSNKKFKFDFLHKMFKNELLVLKKYLKKNLSKKFIKFNQFNCLSLVLFVKKFEKKLRFCVDYRKFNIIIKKNRYSMSLITKILNRLCKIKYYIKINIIIAFNRLKISFKNKKFIAFKTRFDFFKYFIMLFELYNVFVN